MPSPRWYMKDYGYLGADGKSVPNVDRKHYAFIWPNDRRRGKMGRLSDILTGKGPDIFISSNPNRQPDGADGPSHARWSGFPGSDDPENMLLDANSWHGNMPWTRGRESRPFYDHQTRRYIRRPYKGMWVDVGYQPNETQPSWVTRYPDFDTVIPINGAPSRRAYHDPRNWGQNGYMSGPKGGSWHPVVDGYP